MSKRYLAVQLPRFFGELWQLAGEARSYVNYLEQHFDVWDDEEMSKLHLQMLELTWRLERLNDYSDGICVPTGDEE